MKISIVTAYYNRRQLLINTLKTGLDRSSAIIKGMIQFSRKSDSILTFRKDHGLDEFKPRRAECLGCTRKIIVRYQKLFIPIFNAEA
jgi:hypothetical protein